MRPFERTETAHIPLIQLVWPRLIDRECGGVGDESEYLGSSARHSVVDVGNCLAASERVVR